MFIRRSRLGLIDRASTELGVLINWAAHINGTWTERIHLFH